ncbi:MAG: serine hydrolase [Proteobacteria bacterium]|nr:serine hydrolase [Pseudomonadota bacterium]
MQRRIFLVLAMLFAMSPAVHARDLEASNAAKAGMSAERLERINEMSRRYVDQGRIAGIVTMVARHGKLVHFEVAGNRGVDDDRPLKKDDLFRIYSMTKPITAVALMQLYEQGRFHLSDPISKFVPELAELEVLKEDGTFEPAAPITMQQLLTHTAGFSYGFNPADPVDKLYREQAALGAKDLNEFVERLGKLPLKYAPGTRWHYSVAVDVTGLIVERLSGVPFDQYLVENLFKPLGMVDTFFSVPDAKLDRFLPNHYWDAKATRLSTMGPESVSSFQNVTMFSGGGGLVSTAMDYLRFAQMLLNGGSLDGNRILSPRTIDLMTLNHLPASINGGGSGENPLTGRNQGFGFGLGFGLVTDEAASGVLGSVGEYNWGGAAGTVFWVDPQQDFVAVAMIQLMGSPWPLRSDFKVAVNQAIVGE